jgi:carbamoyl-phosphate synthase large subunit
MRNDLTLLFTSAGRRNQLINCFREDAARLGIRLRVLAADMQPGLSPACQQADASFTVPRCTEEGYVPHLVEICRREAVSLVVPTIDPELTVLSAARAMFAAAGIQVLVSSPEVVALARDKQAAARLLESGGIVVPRTVKLHDYLKEPSRLNFPVIAKPNNGSASKGVIRPRDSSQLADLDGEDYIVQELWMGREFTVNVYFDQCGALRCAVPHWRMEVRAGEVAKGRTTAVPILDGVARQLATLLPGARGPLCFQAIVKDSGDYAVLEFNARFGGGYPLAHRAGARFSQWILEEATGREISATDRWTAGLTMLRFDQAVFLEPAAPVAGR